MAKIKGSIIFSKGWRKLKGRKFKGAKIKGRRNLKGLRYCKSEKPVKLFNHELYGPIDENLILPKQDKVNTNTSWNQYLMALDVVSGKYHILTSVYKEV